MDFSEDCSLARHPGDSEGAGVTVGAELIPSSTVRGVWLSTCPSLSVPPLHEGDEVTSE